MSEEKFYEQARVSFKRLNAQPGNIIVVTVPADIATSQMLAAMEQLQKIGKDHDCTVMVVRAGTSVEELDETKMAEHGWYKHGRVN